MANKIPTQREGEPDSSALSGVEKAFVKAVVSNDGGEHAGETVEILADDYTSKGEEEDVEVKIGDDVVFIAKKYLSLKPEALASSLEEDGLLPKEHSISGVANVREDDEEAEFSISLDDLEDVLDDDDDDDDDDEIDYDDLLDLKFDDEEDEDGDQEDKSMYVNEPELTDPEVLRAKLKKSLEELESIKSEMNKTFTTTDTISSTITSVRGMIDALKKDQENLNK